jgi:PAS domain S-box-containing protein
VRQQTQPDNAQTPVEALDVPEALRQSEERFRQAFDYAAIGMALVATDGGWIKVNRSLCEITGYNEQELLKLTFQDITHPDDLDADLALYRQLLAGEIRFYHLEKRYIHKHGHIVWILLSVSLVRSADGTPLHFVGQIQDITARKVAEEQRECLIRELQSALMTAKSLRSLLPICAWCKQIRNDEGYWREFDIYLQEHMEVTFTHGICPACAEFASEPLGGLEQQ